MTNILVGFSGLFLDIKMGHTLEYLSTLNVDKSGVLSTERNGSKEYLEFSERTRMGMNYYDSS